ncbi:hypothetical protein Ahy_B10g101616 isoform A [Arachis hypogaea]|uniref:Uncharacterized protein n=1 Tax=Arachis hypogaea TaxID=3818 RepID=A0A444WZX7_ARAHY|nr:hypothetical protein Ahy_B10g101616 isoform A [Arachis hypogaea]
MSQLRNPLKNHQLRPKENHQPRHNPNHQPRPNLIHQPISSYLNPSPCQPNPLLLTSNLNPNPNSLQPTLPRPITHHLNLQPNPNPRPNPHHLKSQPLSLQTSPNPDPLQLILPRANLLSDHMLDHSSSDSYDSVKDNLYRPDPFKSSSDSDIDVENSDEEVDWLQVLRNNEGSHYDAYNPMHDDSDGNGSWQSKELKISPDSKDELTEEESDDIFIIFSQGARFGQLMLQVGMKFNT